MIVHSAEAAEKVKNHRWVDPNSMEYQNVVLEHRINKHEKNKNELPMLNTSMKKLSYEGKFTKDKL